MDKNFLIHEIFIRCIKILDITLLGTYYLIFGIISALIINKILDAIEEKNKKLNQSNNKLFYALKIFVRTSLIMISAYSMRNIIRRVPFLLDGLFGYQHLRLKEMNGGVIIAFSIIALQPQFREDINIIAKSFKKSHPTSITHII